MKKIFKSSTNFSQKLRNFWFGMQLFIVAISLPAMSVIQISQTSKTAQSKQNNEVLKKSKQNLLDANLLEKTIDFNQVN
ncbi:MAG: hypothetical protein M3139_12330 [Bacteroidota bacterium]|nr:hypothetical protein [Bacteroidota bacterium]